MAFTITNPIGTGTDAELLAYVRAAIAQVVMHGQAYWDGNQRLERADLPELRALEADLQSRVAGASATAGSRNNYVTRQRAI